MSSTRDKQRSAAMSLGGLAAAVGCGLTVHGVALAWRPGGWILGGIFIAVPALFVAYDAFREKR